MLENGQFLGVVECVIINHKHEQKSPY